ncbi:uncharacterized protein LOC110429797 isoform X1 [Sorghum bicolor]|uniref:uncharacterized protein LOC110429797 isoform X1 n=1 Tax=Sorghum bicolor TaxID=4558 RepID=UPI000B4249B5|nr:uncharacterized protein LOC110429797 isoform X1 [Sorghum bicolor]|eukprot:XP_021302089.1 uncharacterized protein LOC110429797 isoform X1 [Sorghum bicolor]
MRAWRRPRPYPFHGSAWRLTSRNFATRGRREYATATDSAAGARVCRFDAMASTKKETAGGSIVNVRVLIYLGGEIASIPGAAGEREGHWRAHMEDRWGLQLKYLKSFALSYIHISFGWDFRQACALLATASGGQVETVMRIRDHVNLKCRLEI